MVVIPGAIFFARAAVALSWPLFFTGTTRRKKVGERVFVDIEDDTFDVYPQLPTDPVIWCDRRAAVLRSLSLDLPDGLWEKLQQRSRLVEFSGEELRILDRVNFALIQGEMFELLKQEYYQKEAVYEVLCRALAFTENIDGEYIDIPVDNEMVCYQITEGHIGDALPFYLLKSATNCPSLIVFRGTHLHIQHDRCPTSGDKVPKRQAVMESVLTDLVDPSGISLEPVLSSIPAFLKTLEDAGPCVLLGHSLGGFFAKAFAILCSKDCSHIQEVVAISSPMISKDLWSEYHNLKHPPQVTEYLAEGDPVPSAGDKLLGNCFAVQTLKQKRSYNPVRRHLEYLFTGPFWIQAVDLEKEEKSVWRIASNYSRKHFGRLVKRRTNPGNIPSWHQSPSSHIP